MPQAVWSRNGTRVWNWMASGSAPGCLTPLQSGKWSRRPRRVCGLATCSPWPRWGAPVVRKSSCQQLLPPGLVQALAMESAPSGLRAARPPARPSPQPKPPGQERRASHWTGSEDAGGSPGTGTGQRLVWSSTRVCPWLPCVPWALGPGATHCVLASQCQSRKQTSGCPSLFS